MTITTREQAERRLDELLTKPLSTINGVDLFEIRTLVKTVPVELRVHGLEKYAPHSLAGDDELHKVAAMALRRGHISEAEAANVIDAHIANVTAESAQQLDTVIGHPKASLYTVRAIAEAYPELMTMERIRALLPRTVSPDRNTTDVTRALLTIVREHADASRATAPTDVERELALSIAQLARTNILRIDRAETEGVQGYSNFPDFGDIGLLCAELELLESMKSSTAANAVSW
jgi:hypothetical protein